MEGCSPTNRPGLPCRLTHRHSHQHQGPGRVAVNRVRSHLRIQQQPVGGGGPWSASCRLRPHSPAVHAHPPIHTPHPVSDTSIVKRPAGSLNLSFPPLTLTQVPPKSLYSAPEQRPDPCEQAVHQGDTDVPPLPTVLGSRSRRGQQLQRPVQPPEGGEGDAGHEEPPGLHGLVGGLGPVQFLGPPRSQPGLIQCQLRGLLRGLRINLSTRTGPRLPQPTTPAESPVTFPGFDHAPIARLGGDWSSRGATPRSHRIRSRPALAGVGGMGASNRRAFPGGPSLAIELRGTSGMSIGVFPNATCPKPLGAPKIGH